MNIALPGRRPIAALLAFILLAAGLAFIAPATAAHAANSSSYAASFLKTVNKIRTDNGKDPFVANESITKIAAEIVALEAKNSNAAPKTSLPAGYTSLEDGGIGEAYDYIYGGSSTAARFNYAKAELPGVEEFSDVILGDFNYGAVGVYTTSTRVHVYLLGVKYATPIFSKTATPTISSTVKVGTAVTAKPGTYSPAADTYAYQWKVNGTNVGSNSATYVPKTADKGKKLTVTVTASKSGYLAGPAKTSAAKTVAIGTLKLSGLILSGTRNVGQILSVSGLTITPTTATEIEGDWQWYRNGKKIAGQTGTSYTQTDSDRGQKITLKLVVYGPGYKSASITSKSGVTDYRLQTLKGTPTISGTPTFGEVLTANPGTWDAGTTLSYQWYAGTKAISKATKPTYTVPSTVIGKVISVKVTSKKSGYATSTYQSDPTDPVAAKTFDNAGTTNVTGTFTKGSVLTATVTGTSPAATYSYQWYRADGTVKISGATKSKYTLAQKNITDGSVNVVVTVKKTGYSTVVLPKYLIGAL